MKNSSTNYRLHAITLYLTDMKQFKILVLNANFTE